MSAEEDVTVRIKVSTLRRLEARIAELERLLADEQKATDDSATQRYRAEAAEARIAELEGALREIADYFDLNFAEGDLGYQAVLVARRALVPDEEGAALSAGVRPHERKTND